MWRIREDIVRGRFKFRKLRAIFIDKEGGKKRPICVPTVRDRLVQRLIVRLITQDSNKNLKHLRKKLGLENNPICYGLGQRPDTGVKDAINHAIELRNNAPWVLKTDIEKFFDKIDRQYLIDCINKRFQKSSLVPLMVQAVNCEIDDSKIDIQELAKECELERGTGIRQGMPLSPILSNFFLREFDKAAYKKIGNNIIRYADDIIVFADSEKKCLEYKHFIEKELGKISQKIPSLADVGQSKTNIIRPDKPVEFLGIEIYLSNGRYDKKLEKKHVIELKNLFEKKALTITP